MTARARRRLLLTPPQLVAMLVLMLLSPALTLLGLLVSRLLPGRLRGARAAAVATCYAARETAGLAALGREWVVSRRRRLDEAEVRRRYYALAEWFIGGVADDVRRLLGVRVVVDDSAAAETALRGCARPAVVLSRHAGPGDSFLLVARLLRYGRQPRIVMRAAMQLDACIDLISAHLPMCFVPRQQEPGHELSDSIALLAAGMDARGALLLFPEGGNFTARRRRRAIWRLARRGERRRAERAQAMHHVVSPQPGGALAAIAAAPGADVIFVAHSGLAGMAPRIWDRLPLDRTLEVRMWLVRGGDVPAEEERVRWLDSWWQRIDAWVAGHAAESVIPARASPARHRRASPPGAITGH